MENLSELIDELRRLPHETEWVEFKHDNYEPVMIGRDISALANSAVLQDRNCAYMLWGVDDQTHSIVGTQYDLQSLKKGSQELENWLRCLLSRNGDFEFSLVPINDKKVGVLTIRRAADQPVTFDKEGYIRVGSYTRKLSEFPSIQARLWDKLRGERFEERYACQELTLGEALQFLDCSAYFDLLHQPQPTDAEGTAHYLQQDGLLARQDNGRYAITNLGAILFAKQLDRFERLSRKAVRVVQYEGSNRMELLKDYTLKSGYAAGFEGLMQYLQALLPSRESISDGLRTRQSAYPPLALRETVANALIHQDFSVTGSCPLIEIFPSRIEITNAGPPLVDLRRIIDNPPRSRNEKLAALMRRLGICEELGTGWDKIVSSCEHWQLPAPRIETPSESTRVTLFAEIPFSHLSLEDKLWACYLHACLRYVEGEQLTNSSLRQRFNLPDSSAGNISRLIKEAVLQSLLKPLDPDTAPRYMKYIPVWA
ncbi:putative DNA binding domain-containing protein [Fournierella massiliensis]|nr:ATP-binding protein [Fournierella massiliensis]MCF2558253.1 putative DNA binding domain-containing protein [Fournierella massiliensis]